jgi:RNA polymerase sigma-70 factor (ECF subfamily)
LTEVDPQGPRGRIGGDDEERRLIEGLQRDDRDSLAAAYRAYAGVAYGLAARLLGYTNEAEDVVQEAFLALWRQASRIDPARGVRHYLLTIVHNKAVDRLRRQGRKPELSLDPELPLPARSGDPEEAAAQQSERENVRAALAELPPEQRQAIELTYFQGMTINEVARRLDLPIGTVKSRLRLAMGRLRRRLLEAT